MRLRSLSRPGYTVCAVERRSVRGRPGSLSLYSPGKYALSLCCPHLTWSGCFFTPFLPGTKPQTWGSRWPGSCWCRLKRVCQASQWVSRVPLQRCLFPGSFGLDEGQQENLVLAGAGVRRGPRRKGWSPEDAAWPGFVLSCLSDLVSTPHSVVFLSREAHAP